MNIRDYDFEMVFDTFCNHRNDYIEELVEINDDLDFDPSEIKSNLEILKAFVNFAPLVEDNELQFKDYVIFIKNGENEEYYRQYVNDDIDRALPDYDNLNAFRASVRVEVNAKIFNILLHSKPDLVDSILLEIDNQQNIPNKLMLIRDHIADLDRRTDSLSKAEWEESYKFLQSEWNNQRNLILSDEQILAKFLPPSFLLLLQSFRNWCCYFFYKSDLEDLDWRHLGGLDEALFCLDVNETFGAWTRFTEFPRYAAVQFKYVLLRDKILFPTHNSSLKSQIEHLKTQLLIDIEEPEFSKQDIIDQDNLGAPYRWRGIVFRTKSEQLLAIRLFKDNIRFLYEPKVPLRYDTSRYRLPDFCIISKGRILRVELDGRQFHENKTGQISIDRSVDMQFQKAGMSTIRFDSHKVHNQIDGVIRDILECVANLS